jgi:hypothetical protein
LFLFEGDAFKSRPHEPRATQYLRSNVADTDTVQIARRHNSDMIPRVSVSASRPVAV